MKKYLVILILTACFGNAYSETIADTAYVPAIHAFVITVSNQEYDISKDTIFVDRNAFNVSDHQQIDLARNALNYLSGNSLSITAPVISLHEGFLKRTYTFLKTFHGNNQVITLQVSDNPSFSTLLRWLLVFIGVTILNMLLLKLAPKRESVDGEWARILLIALVGFIIAAAEIFIFGYFTSGGNSGVLSVWYEFYVPLIWPFLSLIFALWLRKQLKKQKSKVIKKLRNVADVIG